MREPQVGHDSPWGIIQHAHRHAEGVIEVLTSGHGGFFVNRGHPLSGKARAFAKEWSHGWGGEWFEQDCAVAYVVAELPHLFTPEHVTKAKQMLKDMGL